MRTFSRAAIALTGAVALSLVAVVPANAAEADPDAATVAVLAEDIGIATSGDISFLNNGATAKPGEQATGTMSVTVTDKTASTTDWIASVSVSGFSALDAADAPVELKLDNDTVAYVAATSTETPILGTVTLAYPGTSIITDAVEKTNVALATAVSGNNVSTWDAQLSFTIDDSALASITAKDYTAVVTHEVLR